MKTWETLTMSRKEVPRAGLLKAALAGRISNAQGALALHLSLRQFQRVKVRFATEGARGLLHRLRGRPSPRRLAPGRRARGPALTLHGAIDDATGTGVALCFRPTEDLPGYATLLQQLCTTYGRPLALYGDRFGVFVRNDAHWTLDEQLRGTQDPTHFGRILQELGIGFIAAHSPQAKGRIAAVWATLQDRLVSELRLRGISTMEAANAFLPAFLADLTPRFARAPADPTAAWR